jgi:hypothetical protein
MLGFFDQQMKLLDRKVSLDIVFDTLTIKNIFRSEKVEKIIYCFCETNKWPSNMEDDVFIELFFRLASARWFCDLPEFETDKDQIEDLRFEIIESLINYWNNAGREDFLHDVIEKY